MEKESNIKMGLPFETEDHNYKEKKQNKKKDFDKKKKSDKETLE